MKNEMNPEELGQKILITCLNAGISVSVLYQAVTHLFITGTKTCIQQGMSREDLDIMFERVKAETKTAYETIDEINEMVRDPEFTKKLKERMGLK